MSTTPNGEDEAARTRPSIAREPWRMAPCFPEDDTSDYEPMAVSGSQDGGT